MKAASEGFVVLHEDPIRRVELALEDLRAGRPIILVDDEDRENEGDLVVAAEKITPELINFMATEARGLICLALTGDQVQRLGLPMMTSNNQSAFNTAFTVSIEAREGVTTGISAADRAQTVQVAIHPDTGPQDIVTPGHMFPLRARVGGVLERVGQTEGSVDLARMAGLVPAAVICEVMNPDGTMSRLSQLREFGARHGIRIAAVADVIRYRMRSERVVERVAEGNLAVPGLGTWKTRLYRGVCTEGLHMALWHGSLGPEPTLVRVQEAPPPWTFLDPDSNRLAPSTIEAMRLVHQRGSGAIVFMHLGGATPERLVRSYVRAFGGKLPDAPQARADAHRDLGAGCQILLDLGLKEVQLLSRTQRSLVGVEAYGLEIVHRIPLGRT